MVVQGGFELHAMQQEHKAHCGLQESWHGSCFLNFCLSLNSLLNPIYEHLWLSDHSPKPLLFKSIVRMLADVGVINTID